MSHLVVFFLSGFIVDLLYVGHGGRKPLSPFTFLSYGNLSLKLCPLLKKTVFLPSSLWGGHSAVDWQKIKGDRTGRVWGYTQRRKGFEAVRGGERRQEGPG